MDDRPVFVVGAQRSGTTLLRLLLDSHPRLALGPETAFLKHVAEGAARMEEHHSSRRTETFDVSRDAAEQELAVAWARILASHARSQGAVRWGDKSPVHRYHGARIRRLFPAAQMIAVVRHPAAVALSRDRWGYDHAKTLSDWGATVRRHEDDARRFGAAGFRLVRFEDLLADPRAVMTQVLAFLGEPWDEAVLDHTAGRESEVTDGGTNTGEPIDPSRATSWTDDADDELMTLLGTEVPEQMALLGYATSTATPVLELPDSVLTSPPRVARGDTGAALSRALDQHGAAGVARRALVQVRRRGLAGAVKRWREL